MIPIIPVTIILCDTLNAVLYIGEFKACTNPLPFIFGNLNKTPKKADVLPSTGPPTIIAAKFIAYPTDIPTVLFGSGISSDSTITESIIQNKNICKFGIEKLKSINP